MQVADFPTNDPNFDPDDFKYSCIRYLPTDVENAMGPSWTDPRTGEVINATVLVYNDVVNTDYNWRFVQTAQIDPRARGAQMPDSIIEETLEYIIAHEVGRYARIHAQYGGIGGTPYRLLAFCGLHTAVWYNGFYHGLCTFQLRSTTY